MWSCALGICKYSSALEPFLTCEYVYVSYHAQSDVPRSHFEVSLKWHFCRGKLCLVSHFLKSYAPVVCTALLRRDIGHTFLAVPCL